MFGEQKLIIWLAYKQALSMHKTRTETAIYFEPHIILMNLNVIMRCDIILLYIDPGLYIKISPDPQYLKPMLGTIFTIFWIISKKF